MPYNLKEKKCRGRKYKLKINGKKANFRLHNYELRKNWSCKHIKRGDNSIKPCLSFSDGLKKVVEKSNCGYSFSNGSEITFESSMGKLEIDERFVTKDLSDLDSMID